MTKMELQVGQSVEVGGCVGKITEMTEQHINVSGTYYYVGGAQDHWSFTYDRKTFEEGAEWIITPNQWDARMVPIEAQNAFDPCNFPLDSYESI